LSDTAYPSFIGEVEALNTTTIRRLIPSARHQLPAIALGVARLTDRRLARLYWRLLDTLDYWLTRAQLWRGVQTLHRKPTLISRGQAIRGVEDDYDRWRLHGPTVPAMPCA